MSRHSTLLTLVLTGSLLLVGGCSGTPEPSPAEKPTQAVTVAPSPTPDARPSGPGQARESVDGAGTYSSTTARR